MMADLNPAHDEAEGVLQYYPVEASNIRLLSRRGGRVQWHVDTDRGPMILKKEPRKYEKALFISGAQQHLQQKGLPISELAVTRDGDLCVDGGGHSYVLYDRHKGDPLNYYDHEHLKMAMAFKAGFHEKSQGYEIPDGGKRRRRLGKWEKLYRWKLQELEGFQLLAEKQQNDPFSILFLRNVDNMLQRGRQAMGEIQRPAFKQQVRACLDSHVFCEQDFTLSRLILKDGRPFMKELRSINVDLPTRDLRVLLDKVMKKMSIWDRNLCCDMLGAYDQVRPLDKEDYRTLWTDLRFPHLFCSIGQNYYLREKKAWSDDKYLLALQNVVATETSKETLLEQLDDIYEQIKSTSIA